MSLKPLETTVQGREISIECTHKKRFPPPQMYGHTAEDVDKMWKQGAISQTLYQSLIIWRDMCGLFVMGPKCVTCPQALLQKPRPGRPHVIETENFLKADKRFRQEDARANRTPPEDREVDPSEPSSNAPRPQPKIVSGNRNVGLAGIKVQQEFEKTAAEEAVKKESQDEFLEKLHEGGEDVPSPQSKKGFVKTGAPVPATVIHDPTTKETVEEEIPPGMLHAGSDDVDSLDESTEEPIETPKEDEDGLDDDVIAALADD